MRHLYYAGGSMLIGDRTCKAMMRYARALAESGVADVIMVPAVTDTGSTGYAHLLIGPASQLFSVPVEHAVDEPTDETVIGELERRTRELQPSRPEWSSEMTDISAWTGEYDNL